MYARSVGGPCGQARCSKKNDRLLSLVEWLVEDADPKVQRQTQTLASRVRDYNSSERQAGELREVFLRSACHGHSIELREDINEDGNEVT